jgi:DNA invertase Pin-like site-specific DNA recombinase
LQFEARTPEVMARQLVARIFENALKAFTAHRYGSAAGELLYHILGAFADFERSVLRDRTPAGRAAAEPG